MRMMPVRLVAGSLLLLSLASPVTAGPIAESAVNAAVRLAWAHTSTAGMSSEQVEWTLPRVGTLWAHADDAIEGDASTAAEIAELLKDSGGRHEARTRDLRVANGSRSRRQRRQS